MVTKKKAVKKVTEKAVEKTVKKPVVKVRKKAVVVPVDKPVEVKEPLKVTVTPVKKAIDPVLKRRLKSHLNYIKGLPMNGMSTKRYVSEIAGRVGIRAGSKQTAYDQAVAYLTEKIGE